MARHEQWHLPVETQTWMISRVTHLHTVFLTSLLSCTGVARRRGTYANHKYKHGIAFTANVSVPWRMKADPQVVWLHILDPLTEDWQDWNRRNDCSTIAHYHPLRSDHRGCIECTPWVPCLCVTITICFWTTWRVSHTLCVRHILVEHCGDGLQVVCRWWSVR